MHEYSNQLELKERESHHISLMQGVQTSIENFLSPQDRGLGSLRKYLV